MNYTLTEFPVLPHLGHSHDWLHGCSDWSAVGEKLVCNLGREGWPHGTSIEFEVEVNDVLTDQGDDK